MVYVFLFLGVILMLISFRFIAAGSAKKVVTQPAIDTAENDKEPVSEELVEKIELLSLAVERVASQLAGNAEQSRKPDEFSRVYGSEKKKSEFQDIYQSYDAGKDVAALAREYNRGKGEIEFILSLRKSHPASKRMPN